MRRMTTICDAGCYNIHLIYVFMSGTVFGVLLGACLAWIIKNIKNRYHMSRDESQRQRCTQKETINLNELQKSLNISIQNQSNLSTSSCDDRQSLPQQNNEPAYLNVMKTKQLPPVYFNVDGPTDTRLDFCHSATDSTFSSMSGSCSNTFSEHFAETITHWYTSVGYITPSTPPRCRTHLNDSTILHPRAGQRRSEEYIIPTTPTASITSESYSYMDKL